MGDIVIARTIEYKIIVPYEDVKKLWLKSPSSQRQSNYTERERVNMFAILKYTDKLFDDQVELFNRAENINLSIEPDTFATLDDQIVSFSYQVILSFVVNVTQDTKEAKEALAAQQQEIINKLENQGIAYEKY